MTLRLKALCTSLNLPDSIFEKASLFMEIVISHEYRYRALCNRHMDVIMNCCLFGVCRLEEKELTFGQILKKYEEQPQYTSTVSISLRNLEKRY